MKDTEPAPEDIERMLSVLLDAALPTPATPFRGLRAHADGAVRWTGSLAARDGASAHERLAFAQTQDALLDALERLWPSSRSARLSPQLWVGLDVRKNATWRAAIAEDNSLPIDSSALARALVGCAPRIRALRAVEDPIPEDEGRWCARIDDADGVRLVENTLKVRGADLETAIEDLLVARLVIEALRPAGRSDIRPERLRLTGLHHALPDDPARTAAAAAALAARTSFPHVPRA